MRRAIMILTLLSGILAATAASATVIACNIDLTNLGPSPAYDVELVLPGTHTITNFYNGTPPGPTTPGDDVFQNFAVLYSSGNTYLHWTNPVTSPIPPVPIGSPVQAHVGFTTADGSCTLSDFFWTDAAGNRVPGSIIGIMHLHYNVTAGTATLSNTNAFSVSYSAIRAGFVSSQVALSDLNRFNTKLLSQLSVIAPPGTLGAGQTLTLHLPRPVCLTCPIVSAIGVSSDAWNAVTNSFFEDAPDGEGTP